MEDTTLKKKDIEELEKLVKYFEKVLFLTLPHSF